MTTRNNSLTDQTIEFWNTRYTQELSSEDARQIVRNTANFFKVLTEWDRCAKSQRASLQDRTNLNRSDETEESCFS